jgi:hypothetical protein
MAMRNLLLIPLLLLGALQAAVQPAAPPVDPSGFLRLHGGQAPSASTPAETRTAVKPLPDGPRQAALQGDGKPQKALPVPAPRLAADRDGRTFHGSDAGRAPTAPVDLRPAQPRAPPASPSF